VKAGASVSTVVAVQPVHAKWLLADGTRRGLSTDCQLLQEAQLRHA
jgi:hypothetical protein